MTLQLQDDHIKQLKTIQTLGKFYYNSSESQEAVEIEAVNEVIESEKAEFTLDKCLNSHFYCIVYIHILCGWHQNEIALKEDLYSAYVTGYWKTDRNVTLGLLHFIAPANSHTHTLPVHCYIKRLS